MEKLFIPYKLAAIAKEKGFNERCFGFWAGNPNNENYVYKLNICENNWHQHVNNKTAISAPLYQQIVDWFRKKHDLVINVERDTDGSDGFEGVIDGDATQTFQTYYKAFDKAITEAFKLI